MTEPKNENSEYRISQMDLVLAIGDHLEKKQGVKDVLPRQVNAIIQAANLVVNEFARGYQPARPGMSVEQWLACDDCGLSSKYLMRALRGQPAPYAVPHDAQDLERCRKMLDALSLWNRLKDAELEPEWAPWTAKLLATKKEGA